ncbi:hypothetical protein [Bythopirellula goksoeyrii]|uniref:Uncharacterized protein n=1 Tax=Bythopirellula goksoeyrii TaxID=1400387 RepID=A0A5B9Q859_9BACT|nr:hypothetical protein [Bythopirellula goksoeyrii]QEG35234.1 hypothetical protein Pr1d_25280 [Bythopirellula goksoeyrii]
MSMDLPPDFPTWPLTANLLLLMFVANELGFRWSQMGSASDSELSRSAISTVKGSVFGLAGLLLAFSFSLAATRHNERRHVVLDEANALGTCYLRAGFLGGFSPQST